ncbi:MAG TPA: NifU family protein [Candidatus Babeliales bacterium]|nr:NifU family protein [Candidatus Babeliales bacterium]
MNYNQQVQKIIVLFENQVKPLIQMDGGDIEFVRYEDTKVYVRLNGACIHCPMSMYTLKMGVESILKEHIPTITEVIAVEQ